MSNSSFKELKYAEQLMYNTKFEEALERIKIFEEKEKKSIKIQLSILILKGRIYCYSQNYKEAIEFGDCAYNMSKKVGSIFETIDALLIKAHIIFLGNLKKGNQIILEVEKLFNSISDNTHSDFLRQQLELSLIQTHNYYLHDELDKALDIGLQGLVIGKKIGIRLILSSFYLAIGYIYLYKGNHISALDFARKSLDLQQNLCNKIGIASSFSLIGLIHYLKGDFSQALKICKDSLKIDEISILSKDESLNTIGAIYKEKGELDRALRYYNRAAILAEKQGYTEELSVNLISIGGICRMKGNFNKAIDSFKRSLTLSEEVGSLYGINSSLFYLILVNLDINSHDQAQIYLEQLAKFVSNIESKVFNQVYRIAKALVLKTKSRIRNRTEAELLLREVIEEDITTPSLNFLSLVNLCELYLDELNLTNNPEVLDDLEPLISKILTVAEENHSHLWLAEAKFLQAKLALIQMNIEKTKVLLTQAQRIAELHGIFLLALKISNEHDNLLEQVNTWKKLKESNAPMSERIKLVSFDGHLDRMQGKRTFEPPKLTPEVSVLLLIIGEGGFPLFSYQFTKKWSIKDDLISGFLTAFNNFSGELFSKGLDRAKFGEFMILMQTVGIFSVCYIFKGQSYLAKQKLTQFTNQIQDSYSIWQTLNKFYKANRIVEFKDLPALESLIIDIFMVKGYEAQTV